MNEQTAIQGIRGQIKRMRAAYIEPSEIYVNPEVYRILGKPREFFGIPIDCDSGLQTHWIVR